MYVMKRTFSSMRREVDSAYIDKNIVSVFPHACMIY